jgi:hypothetical protein
VAFHPPGQVHDGAETGGSSRKLDVPFTEGNQGGGGSRWRQRTIQNGSGGDSNVS